MIGTQGVLVEGNWNEGKKNRKKGENQRCDTNSFQEKKICNYMRLGEPTTRECVQFTLTSRYMFST